MFSGQNDKARGAKQTPSVKGGAERRQRQMISVRQKAHGDLIKHIREEGDGGTGSNMPVQGDVMDVWSYGSGTRPESVPQELIPRFVQLIIEGVSEKELFHGTLMIRKVLSVERNPPHEAVVQSGVVPYLVCLLDRADNPQLQFEAAWALTNIAAGTSSNASLVVSSGALSRFVTLLGSEHIDCRDQSAWAIGNLAGDSVECRDAVLMANVLPALLHVLSDPNQPLNVLRNTVWAVSNLCRGKPPPPLESVSMVLPVLCNLLHHEDKEILTDVLWTFSYISDGSHKRVQAVIDSGIVPRVVELLASPVTALQTSSIRTVGNIASGTDSQTQVLINNGVLGMLGPLLSHRKREIRKETCWTISNIAAGNPMQVDALVAANLFPLILACISGPDLDVKKEAIWSVANLTFSGSPAHVRYLLDCNVLPELCESLTSPDVKVLSVTLEALTGLLDQAEDEYKTGATQENIVARAIINCGGVEHIERLQSNANKSLYSKAISILETFFNVEESTNRIVSDVQQFYDGSSLGQGNTNFNF